MSAHVLLNLLNEFGKEIKCEACRGKNYSSFLDFTRNYERTSGIFFSP